MVLAPCLRLWLGETWEEAEDEGLGAEGVVEGPAAASVLEMRSGATSAWSGVRKEVDRGPTSPPWWVAKRGRGG